MLVRCAVVVFALGAMSQLSVFAQDLAPAPAATTQPAADASEAVYTVAIEKRADDILQFIGVTEPAKAEPVRKILMDQYRALRAIQDKSKAEPKSEARDRALKAGLNNLHDRFLARLAEHLTPEQVEGVKDKLVYNKVKVTFDAYNEIFPGLTEPQKEQILILLKQAREEAMDGGSADEKSAIFKVYKNKCKAYLTSQGYDVDRMYREWGERQKLKSATSKPTSKPAVDEVVN